jgi:hypothetical protein
MLPSTTDYLFAIASRLIAVLTSTFSNWRGMNARRRMPIARAPKPSIACARFLSSNPSVSFAITSCRLAPMRWPRRSRTWNRSVGTAPDAASALSPLTTDYGPRTISASRRCSCIIKPTLRRKRKTFRTIWPAKYARRCSMPAMCRSFSIGTSGVPCPTACESSTPAPICRFGAAPARAIAKCSPP